MSLRLKSFCCTKTNFETKYKKKNCEFSKFLSFEKLNLTVAHVLNYLISSKPQKLVYILISVYIQNYLWSAQILFCTKKIIYIIPISANITCVPNIQKKALEMCKHLRESMQSFVQLFPKTLEEMIVVCWLLH